MIAIALNIKTFPPPGIASNGPSTHEPEPHAGAVSQFYPGTLLAADMCGKARARGGQAALRHMTKSNGPEAAILARHGVHAATDFGLLGHLVEMTKASGINA